MEHNTITFTIEKLFGPDKALKGFFVTKSNELPSAANPMMDMFKGMAEAMEGQAVPKPKTPDRLFCATPKEVHDYLIYESGEFTGH